RRQVERVHIAVLGDLGAFRPLGGVEGAHEVHGALAVQDGQAAFLERGDGDALHLAEAAVDVVRVPQNGVGPVERVRDLGVVERDVVVDPLVVDVGTVFPQDDVFDPVAAGPARGVTG